MSKYRKKPIVIEAIQLTEDLFWQVQESKKGVFDKFHFSGSWHPINKTIGNAYILITILEGTMRAELNDWIICGVNGEFYPCKDEIFEKTYQPAGESEEQSGERLVQIKQLLSNNDFLRRDLAEKDKEIAELKAWKESAMSATQLGCHEKQMPG